MPVLLTFKGMRNKFYMRGTPQPSFITVGLVVTDVAQMVGTITVFTILREIWLNVVLIGQVTATHVMVAVTTVSAKFMKSMANMSKSITQRNTQIEMMKSLMINMKFSTLNLIFIIIVVYCMYISIEQTIP